MGLGIGFEDSPVDRRVDDKGRGEGVAPQTGDEGLGLPISFRALSRIPIDKSRFGRGNPRKTNSNFSVFSSGNG
jgi:hypothetical protein